MASCNKCGKKIGFGERICVDCYEKTIKSPTHQVYEQDELGKVRVNELQQQLRQTEDSLAKIILTTTPSIEGYRVVEIIQIVSAECVFGMSIFKDFFAGMSDFLGGRSEVTQSSLRDARKTCLRELQKEALEIGADAVIAIDLDYSEFSGQGKSMLFLVATGTAVRLEKTSNI